MTFLTQLNFHDLPQKAQTALGQSSGLVQLFLCTCESCSQGGTSHVVRLVDPTSSSEQLLLDATPEGGAPPLPCQWITGWVEQEDYPDIEELDLGMEFDPGDEEVLAALDDHPCRQGDKVSGYPFWLQV